MTTWQTEATIFFMEHPVSDRRILHTTCPTCEYGEYTQGCGDNSGPCGYHDARLVASGVFADVATRTLTAEWLQKDTDYLNNGGRNDVAWSIEKALGL
jgi:hypothetical protein